MRLRKHLGLFLSLAPLLSMLNLSCYTKVALLKNAPKYKLANTWHRGTSWERDQNGVSSLNVIEHSITFFDDFSYKYLCNSFSWDGHFELVQDTILIKRSDKLFSTYRYKLEGEKLQFFKLDSNLIPNCDMRRKSDFIEGVWSLKKR